MLKETKELAELDKEVREMELELARLRSKYPIEDVSAPFDPTLAQSMSLPLSLTL